MYKRQIDDPANLSRQRVLIVSGEKDETVPPQVAAQLSDYYGQLAVRASNRSEVRLSKAAHTMPTVNYGKDCGVAESPYLGKCHYDTAKAILEWVYGPLKKPQQGQALGRFMQFDQRGYLPKDRFTWTTGMDNTGWAYIPEACEPVSYTHLFRIRPGGLEGLYLFAAFLYSRLAHDSPENSHPRLRFSGFPTHCPPRA